MPDKNRVDDIAQSQVLEQVAKLQSQLESVQRQFLRQITAPSWAGGKDVVAVFEQFAERANLTNKELEQGKKILSDYTEKVKGMEPAKIVDPQVLRDTIKEIETAGQSIAKLQELGFGKLGGKIAQEYFRGLSEGLSASVIGFAFLAEKVLDVKKNWGQVRLTVSEFAGDEVSELDNLFKKFGTQQDINNMKMVDLVKTLKDVDRISESIQKKMKGQKDSTVGTQEAVNKFLQSEKQVSRVAEDTSKRGILPDVLRGIGGIPGLEKVGGLAGVISGGTVIGAVLDAIATLIKEMDSFIKMQRETRQAFGAPGMVFGTEMTERLARGVELGMTKAGVRISREDLNDMMKILMQYGPEMQLPGGGNLMEIFTGLQKQQQRVQELQREGRGETLRNRAILGILGSVIGGPTGMMLGGVFAPKAVGGERGEYGKEKAKLDKAYVETEKTLTDLSATITKLSETSGMAGQEIVQTIHTLTRLGLEQGKNYRETSMDIAKLMAASKGTGTVLREYLPWTTAAYENMRYFSLGIDDANAVVATWVKELKLGTLTVQDLNDAYERAMGIMSPEDLMLEFQLLGEVIDKYGSEDMKGFRNEMEKLGPMGTMIMEQALRQGTDYVATLKSGKFGDVGVKGAKVIEDYTKKFGGLTKLSDEYNTKLRSHILEPWAKLGGTDVLEQLGMLTLYPPKGWATAFGKPMEQLGDVMDANLNVTKTRGADLNSLIENFATETDKYYEEVMKYQRQMVSTEYIEHFWRVGVGLIDNTLRSLYYETAPRAPLPWSKEASEEK